MKASPAESIPATCCSRRWSHALAKDAPVGFRDIRLHLHLDTEASAEQKKKLIELTERYCVVLQTLRHAPAIRIAS